MLWVCLLTPTWSAEPTPRPEATLEQADADARRGAKAGLADAKAASRPLKPFVLGATAGACLGLSGCLTPCLGPACVLPAAVLGPPAVAFAQRPELPPQTLSALTLETQDYQIGYQVAYGLETRKQRGRQAGVGAMAGTAMGASVGVLLYIAVVGTTPWQTWSL